MARFSGCQKSFNRFTADPVFQAPTIVSEFLPSPFWWRSGTGNAARQVQPADLSRRLAESRKLTVASDELDLPVGRCGPGDDEGQRSLGELQKRFAIPLNGDEEFAGKFRRPDPGPPNGLAFANGPARFGQVGWRQVGDCSAGAPAEQEHKPEQRVQFA